MLCVTNTNKHKSILRKYDQACEVDLANPRKRVDEMLDALCFKMMHNKLDELTADLKQALADIPDYILGFQDVIESFLDDVLRRLLREVWEKEEAQCREHIQQRIVDAMYGGGWA